MRTTLEWPQLILSTCRIRSYTGHRHKVLSNSFPVLCYVFSTAIVLFEWFINSCEDEKRVCLRYDEPHEHGTALMSLLLL